MSTTATKKDKTREVAVKCYLNIASGNVFIQDSLNKAFKNYKFKPRDKAFLSEMLFGAVKMKRRIDFVLGKFVEQELSPWTETCLRLGLYQMMFSGGTPDYAAVNEFVELTAKHDNPGAASLVNAVLRRYQRESEKIEYPGFDTDPVGHLGIYHSLPDWLVKSWINYYGKINALALAEHANSPSLPSLRLFSSNRRKPNIREMGDSGFIPHEYFDGYYIYTGKGDPRDTDIYKRNFVYFQDPSAGMAVMLSGAKVGDYIFDIGAAPGGKTINFYEAIQGRGKITAIEANQGKLTGLKKNLYRMGIKTVNIIGKDVQNFHVKRRGDVVLVDVPCSGLGTLSRNADLRWRIEPQEINSYATQQREILQAASNLVKPGGRLIYSTCTISDPENRGVVNSFLADNPNFVRSNTSAAVYNLKRESVTVEGDLLILPFHYNTDGAFVSVMRRMK